MSLVGQHYWLRLLLTNVRVDALDAGIAALVVRLTGITTKTTRNVG